MPEMKRLEPGADPINWNKVPEFEKMVWDKLLQQFWLDTKLPLSNDIPSWEKMTESEKAVIKKVFVALTSLDTIQSEIGADVLKEASQSQYESAIFSNIAFMETIHAKFYSSVFSTLIPSPEINELFAWSASDAHLLYKRDKILGFYHAGTTDAEHAVRAKIASVVLESFLFYSGFYAPLFFSTRAKLTNTSDGIKLILRDESVHGAYIGARYQQNLEEWGFTDDEKAHMHEFFVELVMDLYANEVSWTHEVYDPIGRADDVVKFLRYNANRAAENLGFQPVFTDDYRPSPEIISALNIDSTNFDFFSGQGDSYAVVDVEAISDDEWDDAFD